MILVIIIPLILASAYAYTLIIPSFIRIDTLGIRHDLNITSLKLNNFERIKIFNLEQFDQIITKIKKLKKISGTNPKMVRDELEIIMNKLLMLNLTNS